MTRFAAVSAHSAMQNLREAIAGYRMRLMHEGHEGKRNSLLEVRATKCGQSLACHPAPRTRQQTKR